MGGELDISSVPGRGSTFRVTLNFPKYLSTRHASSPSSSSSSFYENTYQPKGEDKDSIHVFNHWPMREGVTALQILVVDSAEDSRTSVCSYLRDSSPRLCVDTSSHLRELVEFCVVSVSNPEAAIQVLFQNRISVVVINDWLDYNFAQVLL